MLWSMVSNAFCKSIRTFPVREPESKFWFFHRGMTNKSVEWNFRKPDWYLYKTLLSDSLIMNNSLYNLRDKCKQRNGPEILWVTFETFFVQRLNFCDFAFIWERGEFDGKITNPSYSYTKCSWAVFKKPPR